MEEIRRHLAGLGPPVLLLAGEPGIGKTRLLDEAAAGAAHRGWRVIRGGCHRHGADLYAPLSGAVADALGSLSPPDREDAIRQAGPLDLLLPELVLTGPRPGVGSGTQGWSEEALGSQQRRRLLFASVERCLRTVAGEAGVVLALDDLQWAGPDAFDLLQAVMPPAGTPWIRLIGAYRDSERATDARLREFVADLARDARVQVLTLKALSDAEAERLVTDQMPVEHRAVVPAIVRRAGGVPFFLISYLENVRPEEEGDHSPSLPWTVAQVIRQRLVSLPDTTQELLGIAATIGRQVSHSLLVRVTNRSDEEVLDALEAAVDARILAEDPQPGYHFAHDLIRDSIENNLSAGRRRLLHRRIGEALESDPGSSAESLAFHFDLGGQDDKAILYLERAGDQAQQQVAHGAAATLFQQAIDRLERVNHPPDAVTLYEKLGVALYRAARNDDAIAALERALTGYRAAGDPAGVARATLRLVDAHYRRGTREDDVGQALNLADRRPTKGPPTGTEDNHLQLEGLGRLMFANPSAKRMMTVGRSLTRAGRTASSQRLHTLGTRLQGAGLIHQGRLAEGAELIEKTMPADVISEPSHRIAETAVLLSCAYLSMGVLDRSLALSQRMLEVAESAGDEGIASQHTVLLACTNYVRGDWHRGRDLLRNPLELATAAGPSALLVRLTPVIARCLLWEGNWEKARPYLEASLETARSMGIEHTERATLIDLAELELLEGRPQAAITLLEPMLAAEHGWDSALLFFSTLAGAYLALDKFEPARSHAQQAVAEARRTGGWVNGLRALEICGMVEARWGDPHQARAVYDEGLQRARDTPFPYAEARLLNAYGLLDQQAGDPVSETKLSAALAIFEQLGATRDANNIRGNRGPKPQAHPRDQSTGA
jgi:tetratricopeptide (TPR) repeat protein